MSKTIKGVCWKSSTDSLQEKHEELNGPITFNPLAAARSTAEFSDCDLLCLSKCLLSTLSVNESFSTPSDGRHIKKELLGGSGAFCGAK